MSATPASANEAPASSGSMLLRTEGVVAGYVPEVDILSGVDVELRDGEIVTIVGPNGAGKSTLLKSVYGLLKPRAGRVLLRNRDIAGRKTHDISRAGVGYVPQLGNVFPSLTVQENLEIGALAAHGLDVTDRCDAMFTMFPRLAERRRQAAGSMSGGERQMLAMARALMPQPQILLLDEPSAGLAPTAVDVVFAQVETINGHGVAILMVEQNARRALAMSTRGYVLDLGRNRFEGPGRQLLDDPRVAELYLGGGRREPGQR